MLNKLTIKFLFLISSITFAQVGIGTETPHNSAMLEVRSTTRGVEMGNVALQSLTDVTTIPNPAVGLMVYNTTVDATKNLELANYYWNGTTWRIVGNQQTNYVATSNAESYSVEEYLGYELKPRPTTSNGNAPTNWTFKGCKRWNSGTDANNHYYCAYEAPTANAVNWQQAFTIAKNLGGYLVTLTNNNEIAWLRTNMINNSTGYNLQNNIWMGFNKVTFPGNPKEFRWITGEVSRRVWSNNTLLEDNWTAGEPNDQGGTEGCGHINDNAQSPDRKWNDLVCSFNTTNGRVFNQLIIEFHN